jgi:beta-N-acetylhexosaminidase
VVDAAPVAAMQRAVLARVGADPAFRAKVDAAALRVLRAKAAAHLLP